MAKSSAQTSVIKGASVGGSRDRINYYQAKKI